MVTIITPGETDERGVTIDDWDNTTETDEDWRIQPAGGNENPEVGRQAVIERAKGFGPSDSVITAKCRLIYGGTIYEVDGPIQAWPSPTEALAHIEVNLKAVTG